MKNAIKTAVLAAVSVFFIMSAAPAMPYAENERDDNFSREELTQMLSPIALYPDSLLAQILMASTYPLEIVEAERWLRRNKGLEGDALYDAIRDKDWDTSVKSLCNFPDVIFALSENIEQTRTLGDAFLGQEDEVMDVVQELRNSAYERGSLKTTKEQKVIVEREIIRIVPAFSHVVYVPVYDPLYVYGPWRYPAHLPYCWYNPSGCSLRVSYISFGTPFCVSGGWFSWACFDWPCLSIHIVFNDANRYHRHYTHRDGDDHHWEHDPHHRRGVDYRVNPGDRFDQRPPRTPEDRTETRVSRPEKTVEPDSYGYKSPVENDSPRTKPREKDIRPDNSRDMAGVITRNKTEVYSPPIKRTKDADNDSFRTKSQEVPASSAENNASLSKIASDTHGRKPFLLKDGGDAERDTDFSMQDTFRRAGEEKHREEKMKSPGDARKGRNGPA